jgi:hypothetical protein
VLKKFGFSMDFIKWVESCIGGPWIASMLIGCLAGFFQSSRGMRQGCPLSPLLYIIMTYSLSQKLEVERISRNLPGIQIVCEVKIMNCSQFVVDRFLLGGASQIIAL